jgi:sensor c-di-GMP phosphodiesterase-like protein
MNKFYLYKKPKMKITLMINILNIQTIFDTILHNYTAWHKMHIAIPCTFLPPLAQPNLYNLGRKSKDIRSRVEQPEHHDAIQNTNKYLQKWITQTYKHKKCVLKTILNETFATNKYKNVLIAIHMSVMLIIVVLFLIFLCFVDRASLHNLLNKSK